MTGARNPIASPLVMLREEFDDWAVLYNPDTAHAVGINPVGVAVWKRMDGRHSLDDLVREVREHFADVPHTALEDVSGFIDQLAAEGFVGYELESRGDA